MPSKRAGVLVVGGTLVGYVGVFNSFNSMGELQLVLLWGLVALVGLFVLMLGARRFLADARADERGDPTKALSKVDSRFGRR